MEEAEVGDKCIPWKRGRPSTLQELFTFYNEYVKLLYADVQTENIIPQEVLFELNAALDHLSRHWIHNEPEEEVVRKAYGHMKRACLDIFKIRLRTAIDQIQELRKCDDIKLIDNGNFKKQLNKCHSDIKKKAKKARQQEGLPDSNLSVPSFILWEEVWIDCVGIEDNYYFNENVSWAKRRGIIGWAQRNLSGLIVGVGGSIGATYLWEKYLK
jgi:hypothetical protein